MSNENETQNSAEATTKQPGNDSTWCVHIQGPDDVLPAADRHDAMRQAHALNAVYVANIEHENPALAEFYPCVWAVATLRSNA